jgi:phosphoribosyl-ATP pyrophosphohydrolase/phosphoribosyl-AMP cyclohydrolase/histidinol dehydrogenase
MILRRLEPDQIPAARQAVDDTTLVEAARIVRAVRDEGDVALRRYAAELDGLPSGAPLTLAASELARALEAIDPEARALLERTAARIRRFAEAQRAAFTDMETTIDGGRAGHGIVAVDRAGCYAPGGRHPLPSSLLMTAVTARVAGVREIIVASPAPAPILLAAAAVAGVDRLIVAGGAQAVAAMAYGTASVPRVDVIAGPGRAWVTAAKQLCAGQVGIDMLAGPSELVVLADESADPALVAADLLAQAEHAPDALPLLVTTYAPLLEAVDAALEAQLAVLDPVARGVAAASLAGGFAVLCADRDAAVAICDRLAPEHLELMVRAPEELAPSHYGALFVGAAAAEVLGDYGAGPNHVLPTGATARFTGGLSVLAFLRVRTWMAVDRHDASLAMPRRSRASKVSRRMPAPPRRDEDRQRPGASRIQSSFRAMLLGSDALSGSTMPPCTPAIDAPSWCSPPRSPDFVSLVRKSDLRRNTRRSPIRSRTRRSPIHSNIRSRSPSRSRHRCRRPPPPPPRQRPPRRARSRAA